MAALLAPWHGLLLGLWPFYVNSLNMGFDRDSAKAHC